MADLYPELRLAPGQAEGGYTPLSDLAAHENTTLTEWLGSTAAQIDLADGKTAAAYLLSVFTWQLGQVLGTLYLSGAELPQLGPSDIAAARGMQNDADDARAYGFRISGQGKGRPFDREAMRHGIIELHTPLAEGLHTRTRLSRRAIWRLVTDGMAAGFLGSGKRMGLADLAVAEADAILSGQGTPLFNPHWHFVKVEGPGISSEWFRLRGGCCRLYRAPGREFCTTCVLRSPQDQTERLRALLYPR